MNWWDEKLGKTIVQILGWVLLWLLLSSRFSIVMGWRIALLLHFFVVMGMAMMVLINSKFLLPNFFIKKKYATYFLTVLLSMVAIILVTSFFDTKIVDELRQNMPSPNEEIKARFGRKPFFSPSTLLKILFLTFAVFGNSFFWMLGFANRQKQLAVKLKSERMEAEMKFLKSQINPHFLFNVLNNVYSLAITDNAQTAEVVMKLSEMLRYVLYESNVEKVSLEREIMYIHNFIDLQKLKDESDLDVVFEIKKNDTEIMIAPMLLVAFVENAFKHGNIEDIENGWIKILIIANEKTVRFEVVNSLPLAQKQKDQVGGIGLINVKKRLNLMYPQQHDLNIYSGVEKFKIDLKIHLT